MRILFTSIRLSGHLNPLLPFAQAFVRRGHAVRVAAPEDLTETIRKAGLNTAPFGHPGNEVLARVFARERDLPPEQADGFVVREVFADVLPRAALPKLRETVREWRPDLIVREAGEYGAVIAAAEAGIPHARVSVSNGHTFKHSVAPVDVLRVEAGLPPDGGASLRDAPAFSAFPASLEEPGDDGASRPQFRVRLPRETAGTGTEAPAWMPKGEAPFIYMTFGTVAGSSDKARATFRAALDAVAALPLRALLTTGPVMDVGALGTIPDNVRLEAWVPQDLVMPRAAALLCHGGSGTIIGALAAGLPMVIAPIMADQPHNARRVAAIGAGLAVPNADPASLGAALERVLSDPEIRAGAARMAAEVAAMSDMDAAVDAMLA
jgi:UDP:flavonoid glycosyltransferase YjiC (YdhE family)